jgi:hypothetical protein
VTNKLSVFDLHTAILNDLNADRFCGSCRLVVPYPGLHPDHLHVVTIQRLLDDSRNLLTRPKDLDDIDGTPDVGQ